MGATAKVLGLLAVGGTLAIVGCNRSAGGDTVEPTVADQPVGDPELDALFARNNTIRQHSPIAGTHVALSEGCPLQPTEVPSLEEPVDAHIPQFNAARSRRSNMHRGNERLQDIDLHAHMMGMQREIFGCVDLAACYDDGQQLTGGGDLSFDFELLPTGKVAAVSVEVTPGLDHPSVVSCARQAMFDYRFPAYDGGQMMVEYTMTIEEVDGDA